MKLIGLMLVRSEDWILSCSLDAALKWCDQIVVLDHASTDGTSSIACRNRVVYIRSDDAEKWDEMDLRQRMLGIGREIGGTHFALIDADEILTANLLDSIRRWISDLGPSDFLDLPMLAMRGLDYYQSDDTVWSHASLSVAFRDDPSLTWQPGEGGYQHHHRLPSGTRNCVKPPLSQGGGVMHLQFANARRLLAKHVLYRMSDYLRWPGMFSPAHLNWKYDMALALPASISALPEEFWKGYLKTRIDFDDIPWQEAEIKRLVQKHGIDAFKGLDLKGLA